MGDKAINIRVVAFASIRQILGAAKLEINVAPGTTVAEVLQRLSREYPEAAPHLVRALVAVNRNYADRAQPLRPNDELALFPPVSGGAAETVTSKEMVTFVALTSEPIEAAQLQAIVSESGSGGLVSFAGIVRDNNLGRQVSYLEYEAYPPMAEAKMRQIVDEARERWPKIRGVALVHRTGRLEIGETAVLIVIAARHRDDGAFEATRYIIDRTKEIVPIWKKEVWSDGGEWLEGEYHPRPGE
jgi:molybdopterin synthase catalytic subunit